MSVAVVDYPAAHSMDTTWFAVDADGHVARFDSGEDGAVPNVAGTEAGAADASFDTFFLDVVRLARIVVHEESAEAEPADHAPDLPGYQPRQPNRVLLVLRDVFRDVDAPGYRDSARARTDVEALLPGEVLVLRESEPRIVASTSPLDAATLTKVRKHPDIARIVLEEDFFDWFEDAAGTDGLFAFERQHDAPEGPGAYVRQSALPAKAITLDDVPSIVRDKVAGLRLPIRFADVEAVNLVDHMTDADVSTWGEMPLRPLPPEEQAARALAQSAAAAMRTKILVGGAVTLAAIVAAVLLGKS